MSMTQLRKVLLVILLVLSWGQKAQGAWIWETQVVNSPYHNLRVYLSQVGYAWQPKEELQLALYLPVQYGAEPNAPSLQVLAPRARLNWSQPIDSALSGELALQLSPKKEFLSLRSGVKLLSDPLAVKFSLLYEDGLALQTDLAFAVNERWALAAHLRYRRNSLLTYELHHFSRGDRQLSLSYTHSLDGSIQSLGLKISF
jgi:hypothetical protein